MSTYFLFLHYVALPVSLLIFLYRTGLVGCYPKIAMKKKKEKRAVASLFMWNTLIINTLFDTLAYTNPFFRIRLRHK